MKTTKTTDKGEWHKECEKKGFKRIARFTNISRFMDFCYNNKLTDSNSDCLFDNDEGAMYLAY